MEKLKLIIMGIAIGLLCGLFSAGGGLVAIPLFANIFKFDDKKARANTIFIILPMVIVSAIIYGKSNLIDWNMGIKCGIGGIIGGLIGSKLLQKMNNKVLDVIFIVFLVITGIKMFM